MLLKKKIKNFKLKIWKVLLYSFQHFKILLQDSIQNGSDKKSILVKKQHSVPGGFLQQYLFYLAGFFFNTETIHTKGFKTNQFASCS